MAGEGVLDRGFKIQRVGQWVWAKREGHLKRKTFSAGISDGQPCFLPWGVFVHPLFVWWNSAVTTVWVCSFHANAQELVLNCSTQEHVHAHLVTYSCSVASPPTSRPLRPQQCCYMSCLLNRNQDWCWETGPQTAAPTVWKRQVFWCYGYCY